LCELIFDSVEEIVHASCIGLIVMFEGKSIHTRRKKKLTPWNH